MNYVVLIGLIFWSLPSLAKVENPSYFLIERNGCESHLLGTVHGPARIAEFSFDLAKRIRSSRRVWIERLANPRGLPGVWDEYLAKRTASTAPALTDAEIESLKIVGVPDHVAERLHEDDNFVTSILAQTVTGREMLDRAIERVAREGGVPVRALEDDSAFARALVDDRTGPPYLRRILDLKLAPDELHVDLLRNAIVAYGKYRRGQHTDDPQTEQAAADNARWIEVLGPDLREGGVFVALGNTYLRGTGGLIDQLRLAGYRVSPAR